MGNINFGEQNEGSVFTGDFVGQTPQAQTNNAQPKENADAIAGVIQPSVGFNGYVGGFVGNRQQENNTQQASGYVGGFVANQVQTQKFDEEEIDPKALPTKPGLWTRFKAFLFQEVDLTQEIEIELTAKEQKVLTEVHDFLFQELSFKGFMNILKIGKDKK